MPIDPNTDSPSESDRTRPGWWAKCGSFLPSLAVRDRRASNEDANRLVMPSADAKEKKRKRSSKSPLTTKRRPFKMGAPNDAQGDKPEKPPIHDHFQDYLDSEDQSYVLDRDRLRQTEVDQAWDAKAQKSASVKERIAGEMLRQIREYERRSLRVFGNVPGEELPPPEARDMGGQFLTNKSRIENRSLVFEISKMVPKGALLHLHFNAELHPERLLEEARKMKYMCIRSLQCIQKLEDLEKTEIVFEIRDPNTTEYDNIFKPHYPKGFWKDKNFNNKVWMLWSEFRKEFNVKFGRQFLPQVPPRESKYLPNSSEQGPVDLEPAETWVLSKMVLSEEEAYGITQTVNGVWARFNQATRAFKGLLNYEQVYKWYLKNAIYRMIEEKVMYAELRPMLLDKKIPNDDGTVEIFNADQMRIIQGVLDEVKGELEESNRLHEFPFGLKIIYCTPRSIPDPTMEREMRDCLDLKRQFPKLVCGFDLVGAEDRPFNIGHYHKQLAAFKKTCEAEELDVPFLFHAGETLLDTGGSAGNDPGNSNLYDAVAYGAKRIGHGYSLLKHPHLMEKFRRTRSSPGICIELCPISNELLHLCRNVKQHPYTQLLAAGIPCTVNSDNPSLFSNSMCHEFYQVMVGAPTMSIHSWKQLAIWSLEYSCLTKDEIRDGKKWFLESWEMFCNDVIQKYSYLFTSVALNKVALDVQYKLEDGTLSALGEADKAFDRLKAADEDRVRREKEYVKRMILEWEQKTDPEKKSPMVKVAIG